MLRLHLIMSAVYLALASPEYKPQSVINIAHRGSSGMLPEHTVAAYERAVVDGADFIECDICITKDLQLVCRHESLLDFTTDVTTRSDEFHDKLSEYTIWGEVKRGYFTVDFTLEELKRLSAIQRVPFRDQTQNGKYEIPTLGEFIAVAKANGVGIYPEIKDASWVNSLNLLPNGTRFEDLVLSELSKHGYIDSKSNCILQSFEEETLMYVKERVQSQLPLVLLFKTERSDADLLRYASQGFYGVGCLKELIIKTTGEEIRWISEITNFVERCHDLQLKVHVFTFRNEDIFLTYDYEMDPQQEYHRFIELGIDGLFTDFPATLNFYLNRHDVIHNVNCSNYGISNVTLLPHVIILQLIICIFIAKWLL